VHSTHRTWQQVVCPDKETQTQARLAIKVAAAVQNLQACPKLDTSPALWLVDCCLAISWPVWCCSRLDQSPQLLQLQLHGNAQLLHG
jgi:hypothetical protein